jgi:Superinfection immunity protein
MEPTGPASEDRHRRGCRDRHLVFVVKILPALVAVMGVGMLLAIFFVPYWLPTIVAFYRKHPSRGAILALNFFLGWTFLGWVLSLVWALSDGVIRVGGNQSVVVNTTVNATPQPAIPHPPLYPTNGHATAGVSSN